MTKTILIGILVVGILAIGLTTAYAGTNPMITLAGDVTVDGVLNNAAISADIDSIVTELQTMNTKLDGVTGIAGPQGIPGLPGAEGSMGPQGESMTQVKHFGSQNTHFLEFFTSTGPAIYQLCAHNRNLTTPDSISLLDTTRQLAYEIRFDETNNGQACLEMTFEPNTRVRVIASQFDGQTETFLSIRTTTSAVITQEP